MNKKIIPFAVCLMACQTLLSAEQSIRLTATDVDGNGGSTYLDSSTNHRSFKFDEVVNGEERVWIEGTLKQEVEQNTIIVELTAAVPAKQGESVASQFQLSLNTPLRAGEVVVLILANGRQLELKNLEKSP